MLLFFYKNKKKQQKILEIVIKKFFPQIHYLHVCRPMLLTYEFTYLLTQLGWKIIRGTFNDNFTLTHVDTQFGLIQITYLHKAP